MILVHDVLVDYPNGMSQDEATKYVNEELFLWQKKGKQLGKVMLSLENRDVVIKSFEKSPIRRIRRITGYLSTVDNFNDAKQAELEARVSHI